MRAQSLVYLAVALLLLKCVVESTLTSRLIHRFSDEAKALSGRDANGKWPERRSLEYYRMLMSSDVQRQKMKLGGQYQLLFPSQGSNTMSPGNDWGWLYYTWIDIGTPSVSFLVAVDAGSDLLWVPCDCIQCAPLSASYYSNLDRDLNEYNPSGSSTSKHISCSHRLCDLGSNCKSPKQPCPYNAVYETENTSSSGMLVEDIIHLVPGGADTFNNSVQARVIVGCGNKQSGGYLDGVAPDGLLGLGPGEISVPSFLAKEGLVRNSFSLCFGNDESGRIFFGDHGPATQQTTSFLPSNGKFSTYVVGVETCCIGSSCLGHTNFKALVDSGTSFTFLPEEVYDKVVKEFDGRVNAPKSNFEGYPWQYCYKYSHQDLPKNLSVTLNFTLNNSFVISDPIFKIHDSQGGVVGFCLAIQPTDMDMGIIGQNFMTGHRLVFDRENLKLGWSRSNCEYPDDGKGMPLTPVSSTGSSPNPLPTTEQQSTPGGGHAVAPAVAERTPTRSSATSVRMIISSSLRLSKLFSFLLLLLWHTLAYT